MIFFNCFMIFPEIFGLYFSRTLINPCHSQLLSDILSSLIEISGGLQQLTSSIDLLQTNFRMQPFLPLSLLTFGGLSCIAQTGFILKNTGLKISTYIKHKFIQACILLIFIFIF